MLEPLAKTIVQEVVDEGGFYSIEIEGEEYQEITNDTSLICNQKDGDKYIGEFKHGRMHGLGKMTYANGNIEEGIWKRGKFKKKQNINF